jgi:hypothetical protein
VNVPRSPYDDLIRLALPRVLSQLDRDPDSPTYGCFDRNHWHLKVRDFASMPLQQSALTLALIARDDGGLAPPEHRPALAEWARAACRFWAGRQHRSGLFDEYYPGERALIPTSFTTFAISRIYTGGQDPAPEPKVLDAMRKAAHALARRSETLALNQEAASLPALLGVARLADDARLQEAAEAKRARFLGLQKPEGWFDERGGVDIGYLSTTLDFLCEAHRLQPRDDLLAAARRVAEVLQYFLHADGTCGGQYGSRNTEYLVPAGFEYLAAEHAPSAAVCAWFHERVLGRGDSFYAALDDRYLCHNLLHAALRARESFIARGRHGRSETPLVPVPSAGAHDKCFAEAGLWVAGDWRAQTVVALKKGGVVHGVTSAGAFGDYGYRCLDAKGHLLVSSWQSDRWRVERVENGYRTTGPLCRARFFRSTPLRHFALRVLAKLLGPRLIPPLQRRLVLHDAPSEATLTRTITRDGDRLRLEDRLESPTPLARVWPAPKYSLRHVASSMYFRDEEYALAAAAQGAEPQAALAVERTGDGCTVRRTRAWDLSTGRELASDV